MRRHAERHRGARCASWSERGTTDAPLPLNALSPVTTSRSDLPCASPCAEPVAYALSSALSCGGESGATSATRSLSRVCGRGASGRQSLCLDNVQAIARNCSVAG